MNFSLDFDHSSILQYFSQKLRIGSSWNSNIYYCLPNFSTIIPMVPSWNLILSQFVYHKKNQNLLKKISMIPTTNRLLETIYFSSYFVAGGEGYSSASAKDQSTFAFQEKKVTKSRDEFSGKVSRSEPTEIKFFHFFENIQIIKLEMA